MNEKSIFNGADFGTMYCTRDGRRAVYLEEIEYFLNGDDEPKIHILYVEHIGSMRYYADGYNLNGVSSDDIVGLYTTERDPDDLTTLTGVDAAHIDNVLSKCRRYIASKRMNDRDYIIKAVTNAFDEIVKSEERKVKNISSDIKEARKLLNL